MPFCINESINERPLLPQTRHACPLTETASVAGCREGVHTPNAVPEPRIRMTLECMISHRFSRDSSAYSHAWSDPNVSHMYINVYIHLKIYEYVCIYVCSFIHKHIYKCTQMCIYKYICIYIYIYVYIYTYT